MKSSGKHFSAEEHAFKELLQLYDRSMFSFICKKIKKRENAKDVLQNTLVHLWKYRHHLKTSNVEGIIFKTCIQEIAQFYRTTGKNSGNDNSSIDNIENDDEALELMERKEEHLLELEKSIDLLIPPIRRLIFRMNKLEGITQEEIAQLLNISKRSVEQHIAQSMLFLKNRFDKY